MSSDFIMPGEWIEHRCCWMAWPKDDLSWRGLHNSAKETLTNLANLISKYEPVKFLVPEEDKKEAVMLLSENVEVISMPINDAWTRDTAPSFVISRDNRLYGVNWKFNGWGDMSYANYDKDQYVAEKICSHLNITTLNPNLYNEGGAIHVDGEGTLICTKATVLNNNRNPNRTERDVEEIFHSFLGVDRVIWLEEGYIEDETGGHIDIISSFIRPGRVMHISTDDRSDPNYDIFQKNLKVLRTAKDARGRVLEVIEVPQPSIKVVNGRRLSYSYLNFYMANGAVIVPQFNDPMDLIALEIFKKEFPDRDIIPFEAEILFHGGGGIHCVTQQEPRIRERSNEC